MAAEADGRLGMEAGAIPVQMMGDNQGALKVIENPITSQRTKHIDVIHHFVRERAARGEVVFKYCPTADMVADTLTKPVAKQKLEFCTSAAGRWVCAKRVLMGCVSGAKTCPRGSVVR